MFSLQLQECASPCHASPERYEQYQISGFRASLANRFVQCDDNRRRGGVAVFVNVDIHLLARHAEPVADCLDDTQVRLMRYQEIDLLYGDIRFPQDALRRFRHEPNTEFEDFPAVIWILSNFRSMPSGVNGMREPPAGMPSR